MKARTADVRSVLRTDARFELVAPPSGRSPAGRFYAAATGAPLSAVTPADEADATPGDSYAPDDPSRAGTTARDGGPRDEQAEIADRVADAYRGAGGDHFYAEGIRAEALELTAEGVSEVDLVEAARQVVPDGFWDVAVNRLRTEGLRSGLVLIEREREAAGDAPERTRAVRARSKAPANGHALSADTDSESVATTAAMTVDRPVEEPR